MTEHTMMRLKSLIDKYAETAVLRVPNYLKEICLEEDLEKVLLNRGQDITNHQNSLKIFATILVTKPEKSDWQIFINWAHSLLKKHIYHVGTCLECPDPVRFPNCRCQCHKCSSRNKEEPLFERFWFASGRSTWDASALSDGTVCDFGQSRKLPKDLGGLTRAGDNISNVKSDLNILSVLGTRFKLEEKVPDVKIRRYNPISFLCFSYDLSNKPDSVRKEVRDWLTQIKNSGFVVKETCAEGNDPLEKFNDRMCYFCREWGSCHNYKAWISEPIDEVAEAKELVRIANLPVLRELERVAGARPGGKIYEEALQSFTEGIKDQS
jgi:hypothetical protein